MGTAQQTDYPPGRSRRPGRAAALLPALATLGAAAVGVVLVAVQLRVGRQPPTDHGHATMLRLIEAWWALTLLGALLLVRAAPRNLERAAPRRGLVLLVLAAGAIALPAAGFGRGPQLSDDMYRYAWDGRVQAAGIDPYRHTPVDPALARLRDGWLFPDPAGCTTPPTTPSCTRINYRNAHTIYPPVGEAWFLLEHYLPGFDRERHLQLWADAGSLALVALLVAMLRAAGRSAGWAALYAWSPLAGIDVGSDAHVDALAALLGLAGLHLAMRKRATFAGGLLGAAVGVKLYPALLLPAALRRRPLRVLGAAVGLLALSYVPHVLAVGPGVLGFLPQYLSVEGYSSGGRFLLLGTVGLSGSAAKVVAVLVVATVIGISWRSRPAPTRMALWTVGAALLVATPVQPWYALTLVALAAVEARWEWLAVAVAAYPLYAQPQEALKTTIGARSFGLALALVAVVTVIRWAGTPARRAGAPRRQEGQRSSSSRNSRSSSRIHTSEIVG